MEWNFFLVFQNVCTGCRIFLISFLLSFEQKYIYPLIEGKSLTYFIHIDDIFLIWTGKKNELHQFFKDLNEKHPPIKFGYKALKDCI